MTHLPDIREPDYGPAMRALTPGRQAFVREFVQRGMKDACHAYVAAGYDVKNSETARACSSRLVHDPRVQAAIQEECVRAFQALGPMAIRVVAELADNPQVEASVRGKMALGILDRIGLHKVTEQKVTVEHISDDPAKVARARMLMDRMGINEEQAEKLFGRKLAEKVIDVEYEDVDKPVDQPLNW